MALPVSAETREREAAKAKTIGVAEKRIFLSLWVGEEWLRIVKRDVE